MDRRDFFAVSLAGAAGSLLASSPALAGDAKLKTGLAGGIYYTKENPGRWSAKAGGHVPVVESKSGMVTVTTPHEMKGYEHYIVKHLLLDKDMNVLGETMFDPTQAKAAISKYEIKEYRGVAFALSMCNKHDCWVSEFMV